jgi:hypothetical protein
MILQPVPAFEVMVGKWRHRSISMLGLAEAAVSTGIIISWAAVVGPVVALERERWRCGGMQVSQLEVVGKGKRQT